MSGSQDLARATIQQHSKSFALASRLLPAAAANDAVAIYAYCRHADDAIDLAPPGEQRARLAGLRADLDNIYAGLQMDDPLLSLFQRVAHARGIPRDYLDELLAGMEMDVANVAYERWDKLLRYCYRVAGTVGLMMCHVIGVHASEALIHAAHLGIAMQLTNIARDVREDWERGRLYLPDELLARSGFPVLRRALGQPFPASAVPAVARATATLLDRADAYYRSGDAGLPYLSPRCAFAVGTARRVYARIGDRVRAQGCDPLAGRAVVSRRGKLAAVARAALVAARALPAALISPDPQRPNACLDDPDRVLLPPGI
jgi:15-cis-phytoene synthase